MTIEHKQDNSRNVLRLSVRSLCSYSTLFDVIIKKESQILMQRLAEVIFAQGLRGIRLSHVEDLPISIASAYDKPTAAVNDFFSFFSLCHTIACFMPLFSAAFQTHILFSPFLSFRKICRHRSALPGELKDKHGIFTCFGTQEWTVTPAQGDAETWRAERYRSAFKCLLCRFDQMCNTQILLSGILYPTMHCAWLDLPFPMWWTGSNLSHECL